MKTYILTFFFTGSFAVSYAQAGNLGVGTTTPTTKLDVNGAITNRQGPAINVTGTSVSVPDLSFSQYRLTGTPTGDFTITGPTTSNGTTNLVAGARMVLINSTGEIGRLGSFAIQPGSAQEFTYSGAAWIATNGGAQLDYDWLKAGNAHPTSLGDNSVNIYHVGGNVGIGTANPTEKLHVNTAVSNEGIALSQTQFTNTVMLNSNQNGGYIGFINNSASTDASLTAYIRQREPGGINGEGHDLVLTSVNGNIVLFGGVGIGTHTPGAYALDVNGETRSNGLRSEGPISTSSTINANGAINSSSSITADATVRGGFLNANNLASSGTSEIRANSNGTIVLLGSDSKLKNNIANFNEGLDKVMKLRPVTFNWNDTSYYGMQREVGFIAQEVKEVVPEATRVFRKEGNVYLSISYSMLIPVLTKAIQEQQVIIGEQTKQIEALANKAALIDKLAEEVRQLKLLLKQQIQENQNDK